MHEPTKETKRVVKHAAVAGVSQESIAGMLDIDPKTLRKHYRYELDHGMDNVRAGAFAHLYRSSSNGSTAASLAILRRGESNTWREKSQLDIKPLGELEGLTEDELLAKIEEMRADTET